MAKTMYDPWSKITTRNGYAGDEVISALQKSIRRGLEEQAIYFFTSIRRKIMAQIIDNFSRRYWNGKSNGSYYG